MDMNMEYPRRTINSKIMTLTSRCISWYHSKNIIITIYVGQHNILQETCYYIYYGSKEPKFINITHLVKWIQMHKLLLELRIGKNISQPFLCVQSLTFLVMKNLSQSVLWVQPAMLIVYSSQFWEMTDCDMILLESVLLRNGL
jgi:hypothetical protein